MGKRLYKQFTRWRRETGTGSDRARVVGLMESRARRWMARGASPNAMSNPGTTEIVTWSEPPAIAVAVDNLVIDT